MSPKPKPSSRLPSKLTKAIRPAKLARAANNYFQAMTTRRVRVAQVLLRQNHPVIATRLLLPGLFIGLMASVAFVISYDHSRYRASAASASVYIAQTAAGASDGSNCSNAQPASFFNTSGNWGSGAGQIGPGTTVHLCGTISSPLRAYGSGAPGNPIDLYFEQNAKISLPNCPGRGTGCLDLNNQSYITVDGGTNGVIENTDSGTHLTHHGGTYGINASPCDNCEIKNLTIQNIYVHDGSADYTEVDQTQVRAIDFSGSNFLFHDNVVHDAGWAVTFGGDNMSNDRIYSNNIYNVDHGVVPTYSGTGSTGPLYIYNNHFHDFANWDTTSNAFHHDGIHCFSALGSPGETINGMYIYNNRFDGDIGAHATSWIFLEGGSGASSTPCSNGASTIYIFNNDLTTSTHNWSSNDAISVSFGNELVANNTVTGPDASNNGAGGCFSWTSGSTVYNNAAGGCNQIINGSTTATVDYNAYADCSGSFNCFAIGPSSNWTADFSLYQSRNPTFDVHSVADIAAAVGSNAAGVGKNLTSMCSGDLVPLCSDIDGNPRPATGVWDAGAIQATPAASTANLWIDTDGGTCTRSATPTAYSNSVACSSFTAAYNAANGGDTIYVKAGTYPAQTVPARSIGTGIVTISAAPGETVNTGPIEEDSSYVTINGFNAGNNVINAGGSCTRTGVTFSNNTVSGAGAAIKASCSNVTITGNDISGTNQCVAGGEEDSIQFYGNGAFGAVIPSNMVVKNNYVHDMANAFGTCGSHADGLQSFGCQNCVIDGNRFNKTDTSFIIIYAPNGTQASEVQNITIQNNSFGTVDEPGHGVSIGGQPCAAADNIIIQNNTFYTGDNLDVNCTGGTTAATVRNNIFLVGDQYNLCSAYPYAMDYNIFSNIAGCGAHFKTCTPVFTDSTHTNGNIDLSSTDTCAKDYVPATAGTYSGTDIHGTSRPQGSLVDAGAYEYTSGGGGADTTPPSVPANLIKTASTTSSISLSWAASTDNVGIAGYKLYKNGTNVGSTTSTNTTFNSLACGTSYNLAIQAYDAAANNSAQASINTATSACPASPPSGGGSSAYKKGDCNHDNAVNIYDLSILLSHYNSNYSNADFDSNSIVNVIDLSILLSNYGG